MSARDDYPPTFYGPPGERFDRMCDEIDRLRAQVERDRPVIQAARAFIADDTDDAWKALAHALDAAFDATVAACAPDEVNDEIDRLRTENEWDVLIGRWVRGRLQLGGLPGGDFGVGYRDAIHDAINACAPNEARAMLDWLDRGGLP